MKNIMKNILKYLNSRSTNMKITLVAIVVIFIIGIFING